MKSWHQIQKFISNFNKLRVHSKAASTENQALGIEEWTSLMETGIDGIKLSVISVHLRRCVLICDL